MTNNKQTTGAVALLAAIAVLDNFVFVELDPDFESMVLVETTDPEGDSSAEQSSGNVGSRNTPSNFWIDQNKVSNAEFANFIETTGHELFAVPLNTRQSHTKANGDFTAILSDDQWVTHGSSSDWQEPTKQHILSMPHILTGQDDLTVSFKDALAYCSWLGKELPTAEQFEYLFSTDRNGNHPNTSEFRCVKNIQD